MASQILKGLRGAVRPAGPTTEKRVVFVGTAGSSKTTSLGCIALTCDIMSGQDPNFKHMIEERTSGIRNVPSLLCQGKFPEQTTAGLIYEADVTMKRETNFGTKTVVLPFCETSGEDIEKLMGPFQESQYQETPNWESAEALARYVCNSNGYVLLCPVSHAHIPGVPQMAEERIAQKDPDVNISRILQAIYKYKRKTRSPPIEGIAVLLSKYDMIDSYCKAKGMDLYNPEGAKVFLNTYFRQTSGVLKYYGLEKVRFFPVHVQVEKRRLPDGNMEFVKWPGTNSYKIAVDYERNLPMFSEFSYKGLINWIMETFGG